MSGFPRRPPPEADRGLEPALQPLRLPARAPEHSAERRRAVRRDRALLPLRRLGHQPGRLPERPGGLAERLPRLLRARRAAPLVDQAAALCELLPDLGRHGLAGAERALLD